MAVTYTQSAWDTTGTYTTDDAYKDVTVTVAVGDLIVAGGLSANCNGGTAAIAQNGGTGTTGTWTLGSSNNVSDSCGYAAGHAVATGAGTVTVRVTVPASASTVPMGTGAFVVPAAEWTGTPNYTGVANNDTNGRFSKTLSVTSKVFYFGGDWSAEPPGSTASPAGGTVDQTQDVGTEYGVFVAHWNTQAAGTVDYGPASPTGTDWGGVVIGVEEAGGAAQETTGVLWASGTPTTAQSAGSWTNATNATGANNAGFATWTSTGSGATGSIIPAGYGAQTTIGTEPASVDSVAVTVYGYTTNTTRMSSIAVQLANAGTVFGTAQTMTKSTTTTYSQTFTFTGVTWAQLANLGVRVLFTRGAVTTSANGLVDAVKIDVTYTPNTGPTTYQVTGTVAATTATSGAPKSVQGVTGTVPAVSAAVGTPMSYQRVSGTIPATTAAVGSVAKVVPGAAGIVAAVTTVSGDVTISVASTTYQVTGTVAATSTTAGAVTGRAAASGSIPATSSAAGSVAARMAAAGAAAAVTTTVGSATLVKPGMAGTVAAVSGLAGDVTVRSGPVTYGVTGTVPCLTVLTGSVSAALRVQSVVSALSGTSGSPVAVRPLTGAVAGVSALSGNPTILTAPPSTDGYWGTRL